MSRCKTLKNRQSREEETINLKQKTMFIKKTQVEIDAMTPEDAQKYFEAKEANDLAVSKKATEDAIEKAVKPLQDELKTVKDDNVELALKVNELETKGVKSIVNDFSEEVKEKKEQLKAIAKGGNSEIVIKADTLRASIATDPSGLFVAGIGKLQRVKRSLYNFFPKVPVGSGNHSGIIRYIDWDEATTVKAAASVAEGVAFPESTAKFKGYSLNLQKIGDTLPVSEEFFEDDVMAAAELDMFISTNVEDKIDSQIVIGDNTGTNLKGLVSSSPAYTAVASGITDANIYDLIAKVSESITSVGGAKYVPDFVAMNISDINKLKLKKDNTNNYVFNFNDPRIDSLNIIEDNNVASNTMYLGDSRYARIYEMSGVVVSKGYNGADFVEDMLTLKARKRLNLLIREADKTGFRKVTSISAALTTLAT